jgi:hypothetical protein
MQVPAGLASKDEYRALIDSQFLHVCARRFLRHVAYVSIRQHPSAYVISSCIARAASCVMPLMLTRISLLLLTKLLNDEENMRRAHN